MKNYDFRRIPTKNLINDFCIPLFMFDLWEKPKRKPISISVQKKVIARSRGRCEICGFDFAKHDVKPHIHHKDGNPRNNKLSNLIVVCPNCHSKLHKWKIVKEEDFWGFVVKRRKLVAIKPEKLKTTSKKKTKTKRATKKKSSTRKTKRKTSKKTAKSRKTARKKKTTRKTSKTKRKRKKKEESIWDLF